MKNENWFAADLGDWKKIEERTREALNHHDIHSYGNKKHILGEESPPINNFLIYFFPNPNKSEKK
ncbi:MAG: hypothetical protein AABZ11_01325 [Nitrospinota bacterium]